MARVFSYVRFSSGEQAKGGSLDRQTRLAREYAARHGLPFDESLVMRDLSPSAFHGDNWRDDTALGMFLAACRAGRVPRGSVLVVEAMDRLSRDEEDAALERLIALRRHGITIVTTLGGERVYRPDGPKFELVEMLLSFIRAREESEAKSRRSAYNWRQYWERARKRGWHGGKHPWWLERAKDGLREGEGVEQVRRAFERCAEGLGVWRIAREFGWNQHATYKLLTGRTVLGELQPRDCEGNPIGEPIKDYYPAVVSEDLWQRAQRALRARQNRRESAGRRGLNIFTNLVHCDTGNKMILRTVVAGGKKYHYLCERLPDGTVHQANGFPYQAFETAFLHFVQTLTDHDVNGRDDKALTAKIAELDQALFDIDEAIAVLEQEARTAKVRDLPRVLALLSERQGERDRLAAERAALADQTAQRPADDLRQARALIDALADDDGTLRRKLRQKIRQLVERINVTVRKKNKSLRVAQVRVQLRNGEVRRYDVYHPRPF